LGINVADFKKTWGLTTTIAITGTILPCAFGWLLLVGFDRGTLEGFAAGTALCGARFETMDSAMLGLGLGFYM
jgi:hypothetical protein